MVDSLIKLVSGQELGTWLLFAFLVGYFIYREWPEFRRRVSKRSVDDKDREMTEKTVSERLTSIEDKLSGIEEKLARDYIRLNGFDMAIRRSREELDESIEENAIMMRAMLGVLKGLQELGTNGPTKESQQEIEHWLNEKAHKSRG